MTEANPLAVFRQAVDAKQLKIAHDRHESFQMQCPAHDDSNPSVSVSWANGKVLVNCFAGCDVRDIVAELGLVMEDLFESAPDREKNRMLIAHYAYHDGHTGEEVYFKDRFFPKTFVIGHYDKAGNKVYGMPKGMKPWLYHALELKAGLNAGVPIWLVEGEADVHSMEKLGAVATTAPHGAGNGNKWSPFYTHLLRRATEVRIVVDLDDDRVDRDGKVTNTGRDYAFMVRDSLMSEGIKVTLWKAGAGKDATDHVKAGLGLEHFTRYKAPRTRPVGVTGTALMQKSFTPLVYAVERILPQGVAILGAPPKGSKSFMTLDWAIGVATGGIAMSGLQCTKGDVLYVGLEDSERRLKDRIGLLTEHADINLDKLEFHTIESGWETGLAGLASMEEWASTVEDPRLVVIDTLAKAEPELADEKDRYRAEYALVTRYKRLADRHNMSVVLVHHDRKSSDDDWMKRFSGSQGLTGGVDTLMLIDWKRGEREGTLRVDGRDVISDDYPIYKPHGKPFWLLSNPGAGAQDSDLGQRLSSADVLNEGHRRILAMLSTAGTVSWGVIESMFDESERQRVGEWMDQLIFSGIVVTQGNRYHLASPADA